MSSTVQKGCTNRLPRDLVLCCQRQNDDNISSSKEEAADAMATTEGMIVEQNEIEEGRLQKNEGRNGSISEV